MASLLRSLSTCCFFNAPCFQFWEGLLSPCKGETAETWAECGCASLPYSLYPDHLRAWSTKRCCAGSSQVVLLRSVKAHEFLCCPKGWCSCWAPASSSWKQHISTSVLVNPVHWACWSWHHLLVFPFANLIPEIFLFLCCSWLSGVHSFWQASCRLIALWLYLQILKN